MKPEMPRAVAQELVELAQAGMPFEVCGFLFLKWPHDEWTIELQANVSSTPTRSFKFEQDVMLDAFVERREDLIGIFHSHPSGRPDPSPADIEAMLLHPGVRHWIVTCMNVWEWRADDEGSVPVRRDGTIGRPGLAYPVLTAAKEVRRKD